jgi:hypothetical protein
MEQSPSGEANRVGNIFPYVFRETGNISPYMLRKKETSLCMLWEIGNIYPYILREIENKEGSIQNIPD